ncbi:MAG: hypothetical protein RIG84_11405 [Roseovarius sp.]
MANKTSDKTHRAAPPGGARSREERLKAALKANMARRKARERAIKAAGTADEAENEPGQEKD